MGEGEIKRRGGDIDRKNGRGTEGEEVGRKWSEKEKK